MISIEKSNVKALLTQRRHYEKQLAHYTEQVEKHSAPGGQKSALTRAYRQIATARYWIEKINQELIRR